MKVLIVDTGFDVAINSAVATVVHALNMEMGMADGATAPPAELMLVPPVARVEGRDGRGWNNPDPQGIIRFFIENGLDIPMDIEHSTQLKAPKGESAPAVAWGKSLEVRPDGSVWGKFDWNETGSGLVMGRQYRYYSPAYIIDRQTMNIVGIKSVGLTNTPNLEVPALNHEQEKGVIMNLAALLAALGLASTATFDEALNHITKLRGDLTVALNAANSPSLDKFVPKADYDLAINRATEAEGKLTAQAKETLETAINTEIDAALKAGKITPATKDYHVAQCRQEGGLERFKAFVSAAPAVAGDSNLYGKKPGESETALNAEQEKIAGMFGNSAEDLKKYGGL
ncbi:MAG: hypothetical protein M0T70_06710 [Geobacteraceae bacterium]|nr:hypothetical protein [Geobacteraceae bacterium]